MNQIQELLDQSSMYISQKNTIQSEISFKKVTLILLKRYGVKSHEFSLLYFHIGTIYLNRDYDELAISYFNTALKLTKKYWTNLHPNIITIYTNLASAYTNLQKFDQALLLYNKSLEIAKFDTASENFVCAKIIIAIAQISLLQENPDTAIEHITYAMSIKLVKYDYNIQHYSFVHDFILLGEAYSQKGNFSKGIDYLLEAKRIINLLYPENPNHSDIQVIFKDLKIIYSVLQSKIVVAIQLQQDTKDLINQNCILKQGALDYADSLSIASKSTNNRKTIPHSKELLQEMTQIKRDVQALEAEYIKLQDVKYEAQFSYTEYEDALHRTMLEMQIIGGSIAEQGVAGVNALSGVLPTILEE